MKNRISLALKDPILQQGFEIICKENAELKAVERMALYSKMSDQLTKAKEIIKAFLDSSDLNIKHKAEEFLGEF